MLAPVADKFQLTEESVTEEELSNGGDVLRACN